MRVYFIQAGPTGPIKIGIAVDVVRRLAQLQTGHYEGLRLLGSIEADADFERSLHRQLAPYRVRGEWFYPVPAVVGLVENLAPVGLMSDAELAGENV